MECRSAKLCKPDSTSPNNIRAFFSNLSTDLSNWNVGDPWESIDYSTDGFMLLWKKWWS